MENARSKPRMMRHEEVDGGGRGVAHQGHPLLSLGQHPLGGKAGNADTNPRFWPVVLETFSERRLKKGEVDRVEKQVCDVIGWSDPVEESTSFVEATLL